MMRREDVCESSSSFLSFGLYSQKDVLCSRARRPESSSRPFGVPSAPLTQPTGEALIGSACRTACCPSAHETIRVVVLKFPCPPGVGCPGCAAAAALYVTIEPSGENVPPFVVASVHSRPEGSCRTCVSRCV